MHGRRPTSLISSGIFRGRLHGDPVQGLETLQGLLAKLRESSETLEAGWFDEGDEVRAVKADIIAA